MEESENVSSSTKTNSHKEEFENYIEATRKYRNEKKKPILIIYPVLFVPISY